MSIDFVIAGSREGTADELGECFVTIDSSLLDPATDLMNHSDGFEWGYGGSGPAQLALAIMRQYFRRITTDAEFVDALALAFYQKFKADFVANLDRDAAWHLTGSQIQTWLYSLLGHVYDALVGRAYTEVQNKRAAETDDCDA